MSEKTTAEEDKIFALRRESERLEEGATYSSKIHFNVASMWENTTYWLGIPSTILAALAGATLIKSYPEWASACAMFASLLSGRRNEYRELMYFINASNVSLRLFFFSVV